MKKYFFEAQKKQLEKQVEPLYVYCSKALCYVIANDEEEARKLALEKFREEYLGSGTVLGEPKVTNVVDLPVDWNYGYGDERRPGDQASLPDMWKEYEIR